MATRMVERTNPASYIQDFINDYVQNRNRTKLTEIEQQQANDQTRQTDGQLKYWNDSAKLGQDTLNDSTKRARAVAMMEQLKPLYESGDHATMQRIITDEVTRDPSMRDYFAGAIAQRQASPIEEARMNSAKFAKDQTAMAAGGKEDAQARSLATTFATGKELAAPQFNDQVQRQMKQPGLADKGTEYGRQVRVEGKLAPSADQIAVNQTAIQTNNDDNATLKQINEANRTSAEKIATTKVDGAAGKRDFTEERALRKDFLGETKNFPQLKDQIARINESAKNPSAQGDVALLFNFMKMLDPASVVRESEYATASKAGSWLERAQGALNAAQNGQKLEAGQRAQFAAVANAMYKAIEPRMIGIQNKYRGIATQYGLNPDNVASFGNEASGQNLDELKAREFLQQAGGDPNKARELAKAAGYSF